MNTLYTRLSLITKFANRTGNDTYDTKGPKGLAQNLFFRNQGVLTFICDFYFFASSYRVFNKYCACPLNVVTLRTLQTLLQHITQ